MHRVHLGPVVEMESQEIGIHPIGKYLPVGDLGLVCFARFELYLAFKVNISGSK